MARDQSPRQQQNLRDQIAHLAARIMVEDGIDDHAIAKRKAARQAGVADSRSLPDNAEIDEAIRRYNDLYRKDDHDRHIEGLRSVAITVMQELDRFQPHLTGSVLSGVAGRHSGVSLQLFTDSPKEVEFFLLNRGIDYTAGDTKLLIGDELRTVPTFHTEFDDTDVRLTVLSGSDLRRPIRTGPGGRPIERARIEQVEQLLAGNAPDC